MLVDTHCHFCDGRYDPVSDAISLLEPANIEFVVSVSYDIESGITNAKLASKFPSVYCAVGVHPHSAHAVTASSLIELEKQLQADKVVAFGEIGLDYHYPSTDRPAQQSALIAQLEVASHTNLPIIFHVRDAYGDMEQILDKYSHLIKNGAIMHCYSGSRETMASYVERGYYISFSGSITYPNTDKLAEVVAATPIERLLVETDAPYLTPVPYRGKLNYPHYVEWVARRVATIRNMDYETVADITTANAKKIFKLVR